jgi:hypothetical protein
MQIFNKRKKELSKHEAFIAFFQKYAYIETFVIIGLFFLIGYLVSPQDICLLQQDVPYLIIILAIITLFHGFESGFIAMTMVAFVMWYFYAKFPYIDFLIHLLMVMIFSEFHYYWTKIIRELKLDDEYKASKLDELSKAFYSLKISHDQLEKNYVVKPMSIRSAVEEIFEQNKTLHINDTDERNEHYYQNFLTLLEKSFHLESGFIVYKLHHYNNEFLSEKNSAILYSSICETYEKNEIFDDYLLNKAINYKQPIYISDELGNPDIKINEDSKFLAAIPSVYNDKVIAVLIVEKMPFMSFNRENLTSIAILLEYMSISIFQNNLLSEANDMTIIQDKDFRYEFIRLRHIYTIYKVDSTIMALKLTNELQTVRVSEKVEHMLRSLDIVTTIKEKSFYFIILLFPLNDKSAALGFMNRLLSTIENEKDKQFEYMTFSINNTKLLNKYLTDDYNE